MCYRALEYDLLGSEDDVGVLQICRNVGDAVKIAD
jgi:hypothetical protein